MKEITSNNARYLIRSKRMKHKNLIIGLIALMGIIIISLGAIYMYFTSPLSKEKKDIFVNIKPNTTIKEISNILEEKKVIKSDTFFYLYIKINNINDLKAANYLLSPNMTFDEIIKILQVGKGYNKDEISVTFKEGNNIRQVAKTIEKYTNNSYDEVLSKIADVTYIDNLIGKYWFLKAEIKNPNIYYPLEGYLFPETYKFDNKNVSVEKIIEIMLNQTDKILTTYIKEIEASKLSIHEIITMASMVELEAGASSNYSEDIARVFYNRLKQGMNLGSDVTTYYAFKVEMSERDLSAKEFNTYNLYNTRGPKMEGKLPIGPVSNVGEKTIKAVINPKENNYLFFVADKYGKVFFTKTNKEHLQVVKEIKDRGDWIQW
ncbi:MAG: endolytic transglycosylase MltG [Bacilli bacterium]